MDPISPRLEVEFDHFPEPVFYLYDGQVQYSNEPGDLLLQQEDCPRQLLTAAAEHTEGRMVIGLAQVRYLVTVSPVEGGQLLVLRPLPDPAGEEHPFSNAVYRMRECLSTFTAIEEKLCRALRARGLLETFQKDLAGQSRAAHQLLRLTRQAELTQALDHKDFPQEEGFDLAQVCVGLADETQMLADLAGVAFSFTANVTSLPFKGSKSLLTQMLLSLVSNAVRAAGREGRAGMRLRAESGRCVISLWDDGVGISGDRLSTLFTGQVPQEVPLPGDGVGLGLYNARRIAVLHGGILVAESSLDGGACLAVSLPIVTPESVPLRNNPGYDNLGGFSPVLIELSDVLPWEAYTPHLEE